MPSNVLQQAAWDFSPEPQVVVDAGLRILAANGAFAALYAPTDSPLAGRDFAALALPTEQDRLRTLLDPMAETRPVHCFLRLSHAHGGPARAFELHATPLHSIDGRDLRVLQLHPLDGSDARDELRQQVFDALDNGVVWYDLEMRIVDANRAARQMLALERQEDGSFSGEGVSWQRLDEAGQPLPMEKRPVWQALHGRQPRVSAVVGLDPPAGARRWMRVNAIKVDSVGLGRGPGAVATLTDITEQRHSMRSLRESEMMLRLFGDHSLDVLWIVDPREGKLIYVNAAYERIWGHPVSELYADLTSWMRDVDPADRERVEAASRTQTAAGTYEVEYRLRKPDGSVTWIRGRGFPIYGSDGRMRYLAGFAEDVTAAHEADAIRAAHREAMARLERLVATAPGAIYGYRIAPDGKGRLVYASPAIASVVGYPAESLLAGKPDVLSLIHAGDRRRVLESIALVGRQENVAPTGRPWRQTFRFRHGHDGHIAWIEAHSAPVPAEDGGTVWHGFLIDVTERHEAEEQIHALNADLERRVAERTAELEAKHREMESFTYSVSHDLKAPLRGIDGYSKLLQTDHADRLPEEGRFFVDMIRKAAVQMGQLIDDLLAYSRVERGRPALGTVELAPLIRSIVNEREPEVRAAGGVLAVQADGCPPVRGEREGLLLVLRNLVDNAIKFTAGVPQRALEIGARAEGGKVRLWVRDNGPGFDMRYHDRIFEIFQRLHRAEDYPGTGVGLAIVRKAAERMNGRAWAQGEPGKGATFFIEIPRSE